MNKHLGHLLVLVAFVGFGNGLGGGPGGGGAAGSVGGPSNAGAGGSPSGTSRSGLERSGSPPAPKNASLGPSSGGGGGGVDGSSGGSEGLGGHPPSGGSGSAGGASTAGSSSGVPGSSGSTTSPSSGISGPGLGLTGGFGAGHRGADVPGGVASDFGGLGSGSIFDNLDSGSDSSSGGAAAATEGIAGRDAGFGGDQLSGRDHGFDSEFGQSWGSDRSPESSLLTRGFGEGRPGGLGAWGSGGNFNGAEGAPGGGTHGFGVFSRGSEFGNFDSGATAFGWPEGTGGVLGGGGIGSRGGAGAFPTPFAEPEPGDIFGPEAGHGGSFPSSSGFIGSPAGERPTDIGISNPDGSNNPRSSLAHVLGGFQRTRLLSRFWQSGRTDPRLAAAIALGTLAGVTALGSIGAGIAATIHNRRRNGVVGLGRDRRGCISGDCHRKRRSIPASKVPAEILDGIPMNLERL